MLQPEGEVGPTLLGQSTPPQILFACTSLDLWLTLCQCSLHSFLPCFFTYGKFTKVRSLPVLLQCRGIRKTDSDIRWA